MRSVTSKKLFKCEMFFGNGREVVESSARVSVHANVLKVFRSAYQGESAIISVYSSLSCPVGE